MIPLCENCGSELTKEEIVRGEGWCNSCNLPEGDRDNRINHLFNLLLKGKLQKEKAVQELFSDKKAIGIKEIWQANPLLHFITKYKQWRKTRDRQKKDNSEYQEIIKRKWR